MKYASFFLFLLCFSIQNLAAQNSELNETPNLPYAGTDDVLQQLNLIQPLGVENPPILLWIGGGAWAYVDRNMEMELCRKIAREGIAVASVGHRLSPALLSEPRRYDGIQHPEHVKDIAQSFKWIYDHAEEYGYNKNQIFVGGFSSGAHLSALLSVDNHYLDAVGHSTNDLAGVIPVAGAYDIPNYRDAFKTGENPEYVELHIEAVFGKYDEVHIDASPVHYIDEFKVPMLLISENQTYDYTALFEQKLRETEYRNFLVVHAHELDHGGLWRQLSSDDHSIYRDMIVTFIKKGL